MNKQRVLMAMSGGIDSTVSAMLLLEQGYEVVGCTFRTFDSIKDSCLAREKGCCSVESIMEAKHIADELGFEHYIVDFRETFRKYVVADFINEYLNARTPNPCVLCNSYIKWGILLDTAKEHNCDLIATGHYARIAQQNDHYFLRLAADQKKDQTYFLWMLTEDNLRHTLFPLGDLTKPQVRAIAAAKGYKKLSEKTESQDICFIPNGDYRQFLQTECTADQLQLLTNGHFVDQNGKILGIHNGFANYTIGQRKGLGIALGEPAYVTHIDAAKNEVTLGKHDDLLTNTVHLNKAFFRGNTDHTVSARIRYRSAAVQATIENHDSDCLILRFLSPVWGVTPGQSCVIYQDDLLVGGGLIEN